MSNTLGQQPRRSKRIADQLDIVDHQMKAKRRRVHDDNRGGFDKKVSLLLRAAVSPQIAELGLSGGSRSSNTVPSKFGKTRKPAERTGEGAEATDNKRQHHKSGGIRWAHSVQSITSGPAPKKSRAESVVRRIGSAVGSGDRAPVGKGRKGRTTRQTCSHDDEGMKWNAVEGGRVRVKPLDKAEKKASIATPDFWARRSPNDSPAHDGDVCRDQTKTPETDATDSAALHVHGVHMLLLAASHLEGGPTHVPILSPVTLNVRAPPPSAACTPVDTDDISEPWIPASKSVATASSTAAQYATTLASPSESMKDTAPMSGLSASIWLQALKSAPTVRVQAALQAFAEEDTADASAEAQALDAASLLLSRKTALALARVGGADVWATWGQWAALETKRAVGADAEGGGDIATAAAAAATATATNVSKRDGPALMVRGNCKGNSRAAARGTSNREASKRGGGTSRTTIVEDQDVDERGEAIESDEGQKDGRRTRRSGSGGSCDSLGSSVSTVTDSEVISDVPNQAPPHGGGKKRRRPSDGVDEGNRHNKATKKPRKSLR